MNTYHMWLTGTFEAETWEQAYDEAQRLRLLISNAREHPTSMPFQGTLNDGRSRPPGIPRTQEEHDQVTGGFAKLGGYGEIPKEKN